MASAVVFAYHNVGYRCLSVLLAQGVDVRLLVTHQDHPDETIWFDSVAQLAHWHGIPVMTPDDPNCDAVVAQVQAAQPDFIFSFYYRNMLKAPLLAIPPRGAYNMHGSLLPKYRGRVPVNWAIIHGESETGATLHVMNEKPDNGALVDQQAIPILPNDTAKDVFDKVTVAAEITLHRCLPNLLDGTAHLTAQDLSRGAYFGGRKAEDGRIDWQQSAARIHNLIRAVAPPYPGAFADLNGQRLLVLRSRQVANQDQPEFDAPTLFVHREQIYLRAGDGHYLQLLQSRLNQQALDAASFVSHFSAVFTL